MVLLWSGRKSARAHLCIHIQAHANFVCAHLCLCEIESVVATNSTFVMIFFRIFCNMCTKKKSHQKCSTTLWRVREKKKQIEKRENKRKYTHGFIEFIDFIENAMLLGSKKKHPKNFHATPQSLAKEREEKKRSEKITETGENYIYHRLLTTPAPSSSPVFATHQQQLPVCVYRAYFFRTHSLCLCARRSALLCQFFPTHFAFVISSILLRCITIRYLEPLLLC